MRKFENRFVKRMMIAVLAVSACAAFGCTKNTTSEVNSQIPDRDVITSEISPQGQGGQDASAADWRSAYAAVISENTQLVKYQLAYINDDDIPELISVSPGLDETSESDYAQFEHYRVRTINEEGNAEVVCAGMVYRGYYARKNFVMCCTSENVNSIGGYESVFAPRLRLNAIEDYNTGKTEYFRMTAETWDPISKKEYDDTVASYGPVTERNLLSGDAMSEALAAGLNVEDIHDAETVSKLYEVEVAAPDGYVNFRTGPSTDYEVITAIYNGETLEVNEENGNWLKVTFYGDTGWVAKSQVKKK